MGRIEWFRKWRYNEAAHLGQDQEILMRAYRASTYANIPDILLGFRQETVPLRKLLRNKISWIRYVRESGNGPQNSWGNFLLLAIQVSRFGANCLAKALGPAASLPRQRALPPSDADKQQLQQLLRKVDAGPLLTDPFALESDMAKTNA
jgi:hypothetical protein